jgi:galactose mutarotase-like enzyme
MAQGRLLSLVPFSNRIRDGRIAETQGKVQLPLHPGSGTRCTASASSVHGSSSNTQRTAPP